jgi:hypothetical protein
LAVVLAAVILMVTACTSSAGGSVSIENWDGANWMRDLAPQISRLPLSRLVIPGTHDAGTFSIPPDGSEDRRRAG